MDAAVPWHLRFQLISIAVGFEALLLLHGETRPLTHLPARATSAGFLFAATLGDQSPTG